MIKDIHYDIKSRDTLEIGHVGKFGDKRFILHGYEKDNESAKLTLWFSSRHLLHSIELDHENSFILPKELTKYPGVIIAQFLEQLYIEENDRLVERYRKISSTFKCHVTE